MRATAQRHDEHGISQATYYKWQSKHREMEASDVKRLQDLETENRRLKQMYAELSLDQPIEQQFVLLPIQTGGGY